VNGFRQPSPDFRRRISELLQSDEAWLFQTVESTSPEPANPPSVKAAGQES
jgi:hypothetical protein